jgi:hypothetical protein
MKLDRHVYLLENTLLKFQKTFLNHLFRLLSKKSLNVFGFLLLFAELLSSFALSLRLAGIDASLLLIIGLEKKVKPSILKLKILV